MKLFSATYTLDTHVTDGEIFNGKQVFFRIIWATDYDAALEILRAVYPKRPDGVYSTPVCININEALGSQPTFS